MSSAACAMCDQVDVLLKPCNQSLGMDKWSSKFEYRVEMAQAPCACNLNYYQLAERCMDCQTSTTATYTIVNMEFYKNICASFGVQWTDVYVPPSTTTTTTSAPSPTNTNLPVTSDPQTSSHPLSSGAIAGIVVSIIALIVALAVAGYVYTRRKKEKEQREADEMYKYGSDQRNSYMEVPLPQYTGMIQPTLPPLPNITNLRVTNPDMDDDDGGYHQLQHQQHPDPPFHHEHQPSFEVKRNSSPGWRRGSFDDD
ncbi:hypothetical protein BGW41_007365 [Actinomortierella wolfii]|nr:hypothetical protein BGW41_007365 [Actinomortierella wolfii]